MTSSHSNIRPPKKSKGLSQIGAYAFLVSSSYECLQLRIPQTRLRILQVTQVTHLGLLETGGWGPSLQPQELKGPFL